YSVAVTDQVTGCTITDTVTFTINATPTFTATPIDPTSCGAGDGSIDINITTPAASLFTYSVTGGTSTPVNVSDQPVGAYSVPNLNAATYTVTVTDQLTSCAEVQTASINDSDFTVDVTAMGTCDPISLQVETDPDQASGNYRVINEATGQAIVTGPFTAASGVFTIPSIPGPSDNRSYIVEVRSSGCVVSSTPLLIDLNDAVPVSDILVDAWADPMTIEVVTEPGTTVAWSGADVPAGTTGLTLSVSNAPQGQLEFSFHAEHPSYCELDSVVTVTVDNMMIPTLAQSSACDDQVTITATPSGSYLYRWYRNGTLDNTLAGPQAIATELNDGESYTVQLYNPVTGCAPTSDPLVVSVIGALELDLDVGLACEGSPFTITSSTNVPVTTYEWWYEGAVISGQTASTLEDTRAGTYMARVSVTGCVTEETIVVALSPVTPGSLPSGATICNDPANADEETRQVELNPGEGFASYTWFKDGIPLGVTDPVFTATEPGTYRVDLINMLGCTSSDQTVVDVECMPKIVVPNAFRPGPGARNPEFYALTYFIDDTEFEVLI